MKTKLLILALLAPLIALADQQGGPDGGRLPMQWMGIGGYGSDSLFHAFRTDASGYLATTVGAGTAIVTATFTRPSNTTAYASGDLVANDVTAGAVVPITLSVGRTASGPGAGGMIRRVRFYTSSTNTTNAQFRLHLYHTTSPTVTNGDNGAWLSNGVANYMGAMDITVDKVFSDGAQGVGVPNSGSEINFHTQTIYGLLECRGAYTPTQSEVFTVKLEVLQN